MIVRRYPIRGKAAIQIPLGGQVVGFGVVGGVPHVRIMSDGAVECQILRLGVYEEGEAFDLGRFDEHLGSYTISSKTFDVFEVQTNHERCP